MFSFGNHQIYSSLYIGKLVPVCVNSAVIKLDLKQYVVIVS